MGLRRDLHARLELTVDGPTEFMLAVAVARGVPLESEHLESEHLEVRLDGEPVPTRELEDLHGTRLQLFETTPGAMTIEYRATVAGRSAPWPVDPLDAITYLRPSRYVQSDTLQPLARETFPGLDGAALVRAVGDWVHERLTYEFGATSPTGGALETLDKRAGVCRDFAHVTAAMLRALDVPARLVSVYAPQLDPPDFHAVVEALVEGRWVVVDATRLAPRAGMVRVATGRDATDTAFLTNTVSDIRLTGLTVTALADEALADDPDELVELS